VFSRTKELQRLFTALEGAETESRERRQTGWVASYQGGTSVGTPTGNPFSCEWREREEPCGPHSFGEIDRRWINEALEGFGEEVLSPNPVTVSESAVFD
jgi:hypothetical protein